MKYHCDICKNTELYFDPAQLLSHIQNDCPIFNNGSGTMIQTSTSSSAASVRQINSSVMSRSTSIKITKSRLSTTQSRSSGAIRSTTTNAGSQICKLCNSFKYPGHLCKNGERLKSKLDTRNLLSVRPCEKHLGIEQEFKAISQHRIDGAKDSSRFTQVFLKTFKCMICNNMPIQPASCTKCQSIYCKDCIYYNQDESLNKISAKQPLCKVCLNPWPLESEASS